MSASRPTMRAPALCRAAARYVGVNINEPGHHVAALAAHMQNLGRYMAVLQDELVAHDASCAQCLPDSMQDPLSASRTTGARPQP
jgi:hypothetical protein